MTLTLEKIREAQRLLLSYGTPEMWGVDLYGHDLPNVEEAYVMKSMIDPSRKLVTVPRAKLMDVYHQMKASGADVRLEPRYGVQPESGAPNTKGNQL